MTNLDLVGVHAGVGDEDLHVLQPLRLVHSDLLVQQETWTEDELEQKQDTNAAGRRKRGRGSPSSR